METASTVASLIVGILLIIANWKIFEKVGVPGWKSIIPIYNVYLIFKIFWKPSMFWITIVVSVVVAVCQEASSVGMAVVEVVALVALAIIDFMAGKRIVERFGKGIGWAIFMFLLPNIATLILGFGKAEAVK